MNHPIQCQCGKLRGSVETGHTMNRGVCYCLDCQAFARFLQRQQDILDEAGGTDVVQIEPKHVSFHQGHQYLACMRLSPKGLLRWYASCCNTPIGNTLPNAKASFVGLIHSCLESDGLSLDKSFGPVSVRVNTRHARGDSKPRTTGFKRAALRILIMLVRGRLDGSYRKSPFFGPDGGPVARPTVISKAQRRALEGA